MRRRRPQFRVARLPLRHGLLRLRHALRANAAPGAAVPPPAARDPPVGHQALRDTLLLYDGVAMLKALLSGSSADSQPEDAGRADPATVPQPPSNRSAVDPDPALLPHPKPAP